MNTLTQIRTRLAAAWNEWRSFDLSDLNYHHRDIALLIAGLTAFLIVLALFARFSIVKGKRRDAIAIPALLSWVRPSALSFLRHGPLVLVAMGSALLLFALADPFTSLIHQNVAFPGRRIALMIDASSSMMAKFPTAHLGSNQPGQNTFFTTVAAAETFVRRRIEGKYRDLIGVIEFGDQAYVITPFTTDYDNVLLSLSLIGDWTEFMKFPDTGTTVGLALDQGVNLFRAFDFTNAAGNLIIIFTDGQDSEVSARGVSVRTLLRGATDAKIPIFFVRMAFNRHEGDIIPDAVWRNAVESTGGRFYAGSDEKSIMSAIADIDRLGTGSVQVKQYSSERPRYAYFSSLACALWLMAITMKLLVPFFSTFP